MRNWKGACALIKSASVPRDTKTPNNRENVKAVPKEVVNSAEQAVLNEAKKVLLKEEEEGNGGTVIDFTQVLSLFPNSALCANSQPLKVPDTELIKFIRARKLEVEPAIALLKTGLVYRRENNLENIRITDVVHVCIAPS